VVEAMPNIAAKTRLVGYYSGKDVKPDEHEL
jgi:hypothetical protein